MISGFLDQLKKEEVRSISRRYFISNGFDGSLTAIGITVGSYLSGVSSGIMVFKVGIGAAIGLATSGVWSVWEIEKAEKMAELRKVEDAMLEDLEETNLKSDKMEARQVNAVMSGLGPTLAILLIVTPFLLTGVFLTILHATVASVFIGSLILSVFGIYMSKLSRQTWWKAGIRMGLAGLVVAGLNIFLPG